MQKRSNKKILIVTRILPHWRKEVFKEIFDQFSIFGADCLFVHDYNATVIGNHKGSGPYEEINSKHCEIKQFPIGKIEYLKGFGKILTEYKPTDVIVEASPRFGQFYYLLLAKRFMNFRIWGWSSGYFKRNNSFYNILRRILFKGFDGMFVYHTLATRTFKNLGINNVITVGNSPGERTILAAINSTNVKQIESLKQQYSENGRKIIALFVGKLTKSKKIEMILNIADNFRTSINFLIIGEGPEYSNLEAIVNKLNLRNVFFLGEIIQEVNAYFQCADVFLMPGTGGLALIQALYNGLPIITSYADGIGVDAIKDGVNGFIKKDLDEQFLKDKLLWFLQHKDKLTEFGKQSRIISKNFSTKSIASKMVSAILNS